MDKHSSLVQTPNAKGPRADHLNQKKSYLKGRKDGSWVNEDTEEKYINRPMDNINQYSSHLEHTKRNSRTSGPPNQMEHDSENNFDDASSCASDSAIGIT